MMIKTKSKDYLLAMVFFIIAIFVLLNLLYKINLNSLINFNVEFSILLVGLLFLFLIVLWFKRTKYKDIFEFPVWISLNVFVQGILSFWLVFDDEARLFPTIKFNFDYWILLALGVLCYGVIFIWVGYYLGNKIFSKKSYRQDNQKPTSIIRKNTAYILWVILWVLYIASVLLNFFGWGGTAIGSWSNYINFIKILYDATTIAIMLSHFKSPTKFGWIWLLLVIVSNTVSGIAVGTRTAAFFLLTIFMVSYYAKRRYKWVWVAIGVILLFISASAATEFRNRLQQYQPLRSENRLSIAFDSISFSLNKSIVELLKENIDIFGERQSSLLMVTASVIRQHPQIWGYVWKDMITNISTGIIPRVIWLEKPSGVSKLYSISTLYTGAATERTFSEIGIIADSYRTGGLVFLTATSMLLGLFMSYIYMKGLILNQDNYLVFYILLLSLITYNRTLADIILFLIQRAILVWIFITFFVYKKTYVKEGKI